MIFHLHTKKYFYDLFAIICVIFSSLLFNKSALADYTIYSLACPFKTTTDYLSVEEFLAILTEKPTKAYEINNIYLTQSTIDTLSFEEIPNSSIVDDPSIYITESYPYVNCAVIPIGNLNPSMKYIRVGSDYYPWDKEYDPEQDILAIKSDATNFDKSKLTTMLLTGTTALARTTSYKMYLNGALYPGELIKPIFDAADITHVSNESSIWSLCPDPINTNGTMQFCTQTNAYDLFDYLGIDVIELTGNHLRDYDWSPLLEMLNTFDEKGYQYYAAGRNYEEAAKPLFISHNGNNFVFLGCNIAGPDHVFVDDTRPGVNRCDFDKMEEEIKKYTDAGYLVIATIQYYETYSRVPTSMQENDFKRLSAAGAVVVSGSQAHYAQIFLPMEDRFIHYGLGNLFFDQMDTPVEGTTQEFLDKYIFYDGRLISVQVITARLTDYSRPRPMIEYERREFLSEIFEKM